MSHTIRGDFDTSVFEHVLSFLEFVLLDYEPCFGRFGEVAIGWSLLQKHVPPLAQCVHLISSSAIICKPNLFADAMKLISEGYQGKCIYSHGQRATLCSSFL